MYKGCLDKDRNILKVDLGEESKATENYSAEWNRIYVVVKGKWKKQKTREGKSGVYQSWLFGVIQFSSSAFLEPTVAQVMIEKGPKDF